MIYEFPEPSSPVRQGDIFIGIPILDLPDDELLVIDDKGSVQSLPWEKFASAGENVSAIISVRPTIAIVGTQECDALRAPNITLFEVRPFRNVERKSRDTSKASKWVPLITQHARINQKWFYLPADEKLSFSEKMGADFLTPIRIPRIALERLISFRKGRLNDVANQHFRERLAEFFRRYAYDEWYSLTGEELAEYQKNYPDAEPFPWQREDYVPNDKKVDIKPVVVESLESEGEKGLLDYLTEGVEATNELTAIISTLDEATRAIGAKLNQHTSRIEQLKKKRGGVKASDVKKFTLLAASDMNTFSKQVEILLPKFESNTQVLDESYSAYVSFANPEFSDDVKEIVNLRNSLSEMLGIIGPAKASLIGCRDNTLSIRNQNITKELNRATLRQSQAFDGVVSNMELVESFALRVTFFIDEKFGKPPT
ncbi:MAG: hypothetical protein WCD76_11830 [Pyrinomonadaceae bacterium]